MNTTHDTIRYRREAERHVGSDDNLYRFDWVRVCVSGHSLRFLAGLGFFFLSFSSATASPLTPSHLIFVLIYRSEFIYIYIYTLLLANGMSISGWSRPDTADTARGVVRSELGG